MTVSDDKQSYFDMSRKDVYGTFLNALAGLEDDASIEGFSPEGLAHLRSALIAFRKDYVGRHPDSNA